MLPSITRKTDKGLPKYDGTDVFLLAGAEDLVPEFKRDRDGKFARDDAGAYTFESSDRDGHQVIRYRPRIEGLFCWKVSRHGFTGAVCSRAVR